MTLIAGVSKVRLEGASTGGIISDIVVTTSGAVSVTISTAAGGAGSTSVNLVGSAGFAPVTSSFGLLVQSTQPITLSSAPLVVVASSGGTQLVQSTAATNPWSSAPGFNMPVVSVSSGLVQVSGTATIVSASSGVVQVLTSGTLVVVNTSSGLVQISGTPTVELSTGVTLGTTPIFVQFSSGAAGPKAIKTTAGKLYSLIAWSTDPADQDGYVQIFNLTTANITLGTTVPTLVVPCAQLSTGAAVVGGPTAEVPLVYPISARGLVFGTAISVAVTLSVTGSTALTGRAYISAEFS